MQFKTFVVGAGIVGAFCFLGFACSSNGNPSVDDQAGGMGGDATSGGEGGTNVSAGGSAGARSDRVGGNSGAGGVAGTAGSAGMAGVGGSRAGGSGGAPGTGGAQTGGMAGMAAAGGASGGAVGTAALYAWDNFATAPGDINGTAERGFFDLGKTSGKGWTRGWDEGEHSEAGYFAFANATPLKFGMLATSANYLTRRFWDLGRVIDLKQPALAPMVQDELIAKAGTVMWLSALMRLEAPSKSKGDDLAAVTFHRSGLGYHHYGNDSSWLAGVYPSLGMSNWTLWVGRGTGEPEPNLQNAHMSNKPVKIGTAQLIVVKVEISGGESDKVSLYVDPANLGGTEPAAADAVAMTGLSARFRSFAFVSSTGDERSNSVSLDEVRIGPSFAAVTPTQ